MFKQAFMLSTVCAGVHFSPTGVPMRLGGPVAEWRFAGEALCCADGKCFQQHFLDDISLHSLKTGVGGWEESEGYGKGKGLGRLRRGAGEGRGLEHTHQFCSTSKKKKLQIKLWTRAASWSIEHKCEKKKALHNHK